MVFFLTITYLSLGTAYFYIRQTPHIFSQIVHCALLPSLSRATPTSSLEWLVRQQKCFSFKILRNKIKFAWKKNVHNITESREFLHRNEPYIL